ncbi:MAG: hypothetical protein QM704_26415 [Anaeromyxobacteraceae bacterium]
MKTTPSTRLVVAALALAALAACSKDSKPKPTPPGPAGLVVTLGATATAGTPASVTVAVASTAGGTLASYTGTVTLTSTDAAAVLPAPLVFAAADAGTKTVQVTFKTAGAQLVSAADTAGVRGAAGTTVAPGAAAAVVLAGVPAATAPGAPIAATLTARDASGNVATGFAGTATFTSDDPAAVLPGPVTFATGDAGEKAVGLSLRTPGTRTVSVAVTGLPSVTANVDVAPGPAASLGLELAGTGVADAAHTLTVRALDAYGNAATAFTGTVSFTGTDAAAPAIAAVTFAAPDLGVKVVPGVKFRTAGEQAITATSGALVARVSKTVLAGPPASLALSGAPASTAAGTPFALVLQARDAFGNAAGLTGAVGLASDDPAAELPAAVTLAPGDAGRAAVGVTLRTAGAHAVTATAAGLPPATATVTVGHGAPASIGLELAGSYVVDDAHVLTATVRDAYGNVATGFGGTVSFANTDLGAPSIADVAFAPGDQGVRSVSGVRFYTAGDQTILASSGALTGRVEHPIVPAPAVALALAGAPSAVDAGDAFAVTAEARDLHGNLATGFTGAVAFTSDDPAARLPAAGPADAGVRLATVTLETAPTAALTASSAGLTDATATLTVHPGAALLALSLPADANAGEEVTGTLTVKDAYGNAVPAFAATVTFATSDPGAAAPPAIVLDGTQPPSIPVPMTFATLGAQSLTATALARTASATSTVHGLVYTDPAPGGRVRLVRNAASTASVVQLDLVTGNGLVASYGAGLALPLAPGKVVADATLLVEPATVAFTLGTAPKAVAAALATTGPAANVLLAGVSQKAAGAGAKTTDTTLALGATVFSVRLRLATGASPGTVLDGTALAAGARAAVRDRLGKDTAELGDFAIGQLVVR